MKALLGVEQSNRQHSRLMKTEQDNHRPRNLAQEADVFPDQLPHRCGYGS